MAFLLKYFCVSMLVTSVCGQFYEDRRCRCICPSLPAVLNGSIIDRKIYTSNVPPNKCNCDGVILPQIGAQLNGREQEFCPRCECKYETRNTTIILVVVVILLWMLLLLFVYMAFLFCLDPLINKRRVKFYQERGSEEARTLLIQGEDNET